MNDSVKTVVFVVTALLAATAVAAGLKTWQSNESVTANDLNANFQYVSNRANRSLTNADVSPSAAIAHTKLATPSLVPKAWASILAVCTTGTCTLAASSGNITITWEATGEYSIVTSPARPNLSFATFVTSYALGDICTAGEDSGVRMVRCYTHAGVAVNSAFSVMILDNDN